MKGATGRVGLILLTVIVMLHCRNTVVIRQIDRHNRMPGRKLIRDI
ncbi:MAG: hypothetical protein ACXWTH_05845 [Methylosarcina sp.]